MKLFVNSDSTINSWTEYLPHKLSSPLDFSFDDNDVVESKHGSGYTFPEGVGQGLSSEQLQELRLKALAEKAKKNNGPKL